MGRADILLSRLQRVRKAGANRWRACCPSCGGRNATKLSIAELDDGRVLVHCFAGCGVDEICAAAGVALEDLFPPRASDDRRAPPVRKPWTAREIAQALGAELYVAWVLLTDLANNKPITQTDRKRAGEAAKRCAALIAELAPDEG